MNRDELKRIRDAAVEGIEVFGERYHSPLPKDLRDWYCYMPDGGHSILAALGQHVTEEMGAEALGELLVALPVKTVLRDYRMQAGVPVVSGVEYDSAVGARVPDGDTEYRNAQAQKPATFVSAFGVGAPIDAKMRAKLEPAGPEQAFLDNGTAFIVGAGWSESERSRLGGDLTVACRDARDTGILSLVYERMSFDMPVGQMPQGNGLAIIVIDSRNWTTVASRMIGLSPDVFAFLQAKGRRASQLSHAALLSAIEKAYTRFDSLPVVAKQHFGRA